MSEKDVSKELFDFMLEQLGGEEEVFQKFKEQRLEALLKNTETTLGEMLEEAEAGGWISWLKGQKLSTVIEMTTGSTVGAGKTGKRITKAEKEQLVEGILGFLKDNPDSAVTDIAEAVGHDVKTTGTQLRSLVAEKKVKKKGERKATRYSLK